MDKKIPNLDSLRTLAFLSTFLAHAFFSDSQDIVAQPLFQWMLSLQEIFFFGVQLFFVLSGFLITFLMLKEFEDKGRFNLIGFYLRRLLRIWPVYYLVLFFGFVVFPILKLKITGVAVLENASPWYYVVFLSNYDQIVKNQLPYGVGLGPTWSVAIEEQFYLFWPLLLLLFRKKRFVYPVILAMAVSLLVGSIERTNTKSLIHCMLYLSTGGLFAYVAVYKNRLSHTLTHAPTAIRLSSIPVLLIALYSNCHFALPYALHLLIAGLMGYIILYQAFGPRPHIDHFTWLRILGKYTYGFYLYHSICNFFAKYIIQGIGFGEDNLFICLLARPILSLLLTIVLGMLSYHYFESHFLRLKERISNRKASFGV